MEDTLALTPPDNSVQEEIKKIEQEAGTDIKLCYQCGKCTAGCPVAFAMDYPPRQIIRLLQLNALKEALSANSIWICAACDTCSSRCPRGVEPAALMDALRRKALANKQIGDPKVAIFNEAFLRWVEKYGRTYETGVLLEHNLRTGQFFKDAELGMPMMKRGKLVIRPEKVKDRAAVAAMFKYAREAGEE